MAKRKGFPFEHKGLCTPSSRCPHCRAWDLLVAALSEEKREEFLRVIAGQPSRTRTRGKGASLEPDESLSMTARVTDYLNLSETALKALRKAGVKTMSDLVEASQEDLADAGLDGRARRGMESQLAKLGLSFA